MRKYEKADVPSSRAGSARRFVKRAVARARRRDGKRRLEDAPTKNAAYIRGWMS